MSGVEYSKKGLNSIKSVILLDLSLNSVKLRIYPTYNILKHRNT